MTNADHLSQPAKITMFTTSHCSDCHTAKAYFKQKDIPYLEVDIEVDGNAEHFVKNLNRGFASVPTIVFPDGSILVEPNIQDLNAKFLSHESHS